MRHEAIAITVEMYELARAAIQQDRFDLGDLKQRAIDLPLSPYLISELWRSAVQIGRKRGHGELEKLFYHKDGRVVGYHRPNVLTLNRV